MLISPTQTAIDAVSACVPHFELLASSGIAKRPHLAIVVGTRNWDGSYTALHRHAIGNEAQWEYEYFNYADGKARITARTGLPSRIVHTTHQHLLEPGDCAYWGSVTNGQIIVACSGVQPWVDEHMAKTILALMEAIHENAVATQRETAHDVGWL